MIERQYLGSEKLLKKVLPELFPELTYSEIMACLRRRDVKIDGVRTSSDSFSIRDGSIITIYPRVKKEVRVLYEDDRILACYKPKGVASEGKASFDEMVRAEKGEVRLMHRLDTNTDGVLLFAKDEIAYREIFDAMKNGLILKEYQAEVYGHPAVKGEVSLDYHYKKDADHGRALISDAPKAGYLPVHISFRVLKEKEQSAVLLVTLHKGKMHQIRAMLAHYGYFILGDGKYGSDRVNRMLGVKRTLLTACAVRFELPESFSLSYLNSVTISI